MYQSHARAKFVGAVCKLFNQTVLCPLDGFCAPPYDAPLLHRPVFLIGPPRSGSTLLFQSITNAFDVSYLSNLHCRFYGAPALAERFFRSRPDRRLSDFTSLHGATEGSSAPSECGQWWYRFFRKDPPYVPLGEEDPRKMCRFRRSIAAFTQATGCPVFFKNLYATLRLRQIALYLPESLFIVVDRSLIDNAHSLLEARSNRYGNYSCWFSVPPPEVERLKVLPPEQQVVEQIRHIHGLIRHDITQGNIAPERFLYVSYEALCADVHGTLNSVDDFFTRWGMNVTRRLLPPASFEEHRGRVNIDLALYRALQEYVRDEGADRA